MVIIHHHRDRILYRVSLRFRAPLHSWNGRELAALQIRSTKGNPVRKMMYLNLDTRKQERK